ncbi:MAG: hypothetical protein ACFFB0_18655 [Promethearchaeota archaeon]
MVDAHNQVFFGKNTGLFIQTSSKTGPYMFLRCIKIKPDGSWEKPSKNEGKTIKVGLEEIVMILQVLTRKSESWKTVNIFKDNKTPILFQWNQYTLWINIGEYRKKLLYPQVEISRLLLQHILQEKIEFATIKARQNENTIPSFSELNNIEVVEEREGF